MVSTLFYTNFKFYFILSSKRDYIFVYSFKIFKYMADLNMLLMCQTILNSLRSI